MATACAPVGSVISDPGAGLANTGVLRGVCRRLRPQLQVHTAGVAGGAVFFCLSLTPSLLPRDWIFQGLIGGIDAVIGYGVGVGLATVVVRVVLTYRAWWPPAPRIRRRGHQVTVAAASVACVLMIVPAAAWQRHVAMLMGIDGPTTWGHLRTLIVAAGVAAALLSVSRMLRVAVRVVALTLVRRWHVPEPVALLLGGALVVALIVGLVDGAVPRGFFAAANAAFQPHNTTTRPGISPPPQPEKSGSATSFAPWDTLGFQGRNFVATGPHAADLTRLNGRPAKEPIRIYAVCAPPTPPRAGWTFSARNSTARAPSTARSW